MAGGGSRLTAVTYVGRAGVGTVTAQQGRAQLLRPQEVMVVLCQSILPARLLLYVPAYPS